jgi:formate dehydrogenase iron-sulfur subunit
VQKIYGEEDAGGTCVLVLSPVPFGQLGLPESLPDKPLPVLTVAALSKVPAVVGAGGVLLAGLWWLTQRKAEVAEAEGHDSVARRERG